MPAGWEQRPFGLFCFPAELDELVSEQNPQNSMKESLIWLVTIEHQKIVLRRMKIFKNLLLLKPLKNVGKKSPLLPIMSSFPFSLQSSFLPHPTLGHNKNRTIQLKARESL